MQSDAFKSDLLATELCTNNLDACNNLAPKELDIAVRAYDKTLTKLIDHQAPLKTKTLKTRPSSPCYNSEIDAAKRLCRKLERAWRRSRSPDDLQIFKTQKNHVSYIINKAKRAYYTNFISENSGSQAKLFRSAKSLLTPKEDLCFLNYSNKDMLCNDIGEFFVQKNTRIRREIDATILSEDIRALLPDDQVLPDSCST